MKSKKFSSRREYYNDSFCYRLLVACYSLLFDSYSGWMSVRLVADRFPDNARSYSSVKALWYEYVPLLEQGSLSNGMLNLRVVLENDDITSSCILIQNMVNIGRFRKWNIFVAVIVNVSLCAISMLLIPMKWAARILRSLQWNWRRICPCSNG